MSAADIGATVVDKVQEAICTVTGGECGDGVTAAEGGGGGEVGGTDPASGEDGGGDEGGEGEGSEDPDEETSPDGDEADPEIVEDATEDIEDELGDFWGTDYGDIADILEGLDPAACARASAARSPGAGTGGCRPWCASTAGSAG